MPKQKIEIEADVPDGWEATGFHKPKKGEWYVDGKDVRMASFDFQTTPCLILRRREPVRESRWVSVYEHSTGYLFATRHQCDVASGATSPRAGVIRLDYEGNNLVAVTLEPQ